MLVLKFSGLILIITACSLMGFLKGQSIRQRCKKLSFFCDGLDTLYEHISNGGAELNVALKKSFDKCDFLNDADLNRQDKTIINELFTSLGHSAKNIECDRIRLCGITMQKRLKAAEQDMAQKCKIYSTFGVCIGLGLAVLLI